MRICYFIPGPLSRGAPGSAELEHRESFLTQRAFPGTTVIVRETSQGPSSIESAAEECLAVPGLLDALPQLEEEFDGVIVGCFGDPGLEAAREMVRIPVIGPGQAALHLASQLGDTFGILAVVKGTVPSNRRQVAAAGLSSRLSGIRAVDIPVLELRERREEAVEHLAVLGSRLLEEGAHVLVLGCMSMGFLQVASELKRRLGVPVVNPASAALKTAEAIISCKLLPSRRSYPLPRKMAATA